ncbi:cytidine deaminase [Acidaminobacterium chupaoyuni]
MDFKEMIARAKAVVGHRELTGRTSVGSVAAALLSASGAIYTGINIDTACSMGFCAEHAAIAAMVTAGESHIIAAVAVDERGKIVPPCGRCRQFMAQLHEENHKAQIMVAEDTVVTLDELLPWDWQEARPPEVSNTRKKEI